jgi:hypothetical protein
VRSVETVDAPEGRAASVANKTLPAIYFADFERSTKSAFRIRYLKTR